MEGVDFNEVEPARSFAPTGSRMTQYLVKSGFAKDAAQANIILIGVVLVSAVLALFLIYYALSSGPEPLSEQERARLEASTQPRR